MSEPPDDETPPAPRFTPPVAPDGTPRFTPPVAPTSTPARTTPPAPVAAKAWDPRELPKPAMLALVVVMALAAGLGGGLVMVGLLLVARGRLRSGIPLLVAGATLVVALVVVQGSYRAYRVPGAAMLPTFHAGDRVLARRDGQVKVGDLALFRAPLQAQRGRCASAPPRGAMCAVAGRALGRLLLAGRVVAGPGDRIALRGGRLVRNGRPVEERFVRPCRPADACEDPTTITVPARSYFVLHDNRGQADDSRLWGPVSARAVIGRVALRYWPLGRFGAP